MTVAILETPRPTKNEVTQPPKGTGVTSVYELNSRARQEIEDILESVGVSVEGKGLGVTPPIEKPVLTTHLVKAVGAVNVGHEEPNNTQIELETLGRDAEQGMKGFLKRIFFGGHTENRAGPPTWFNKMFRRRVAQERVVGQKDITQKDF